MRIVFCADPLDHSQPDYIQEAEATGQVGLDYGLINYEALVYDDDASTATADIPRADEPLTAIYRGGSLKPDHYAALYDALLTKNVQLINSPVQYLHAHYLPESYSILADHTPRSMWLACSVEVPMGEVKTLLQYFGMKSVTICDYAHSQKHYSADTSFIPLASDGETAERVVKRLVEMSEDGIEGGLVFREFPQLQTFGTHPQSGMPMAVEFRVFWLDGEPISISPYWQQGDYAKLTPPVDEFRGIAQEIRSRFFAMDLARRSDGEWLILEIEDGQVAALPDHADLVNFYRRLASV